MSTKTRRVVSLLVVIVAGLASLATSRAYSSEEAAFGRSEVGGQGTRIAVSIRMSGVDPQSYASPEQTQRLTFDALGDGDAPAAVPIEVRVAGPEGPLTSPEWSPSSVTLPLDVTGCETACQRQYEISLRTVGGSGGPLVVPWRVYAVVYSGTLDLEVEHAADAPSALEPALAGFAGGILAALLLGAVLALTLRSRSKLAVLEALAAITFLVVGAVTTISALVGMPAGTGGPLLIIGGLVVLIGVALKRPRLSAPCYWLIPIGLVAPHVVLARFVIAGFYVPIEIIATFATIGFGFAVAVALAGQVLVRAMADLTMSSVRLLLMTTIAALCVVVAYAWAFLAAAGIAYGTVGTTIPFAAYYLIILIAFWRWLGGDSVTPFIVGLVSPLLTGLAFLILFGTAFFNLFATLPPGSSTDYFIESCGLLALGGFAFGLIALLPPARKDQRPRRVLQFSWDPAEPKHSAIE